MADDNRILTTHTGSLPRPADLVELMLQQDRGDQPDEAALKQRIAEATAEVVRRQIELGIDIPSDGEYGKASYASYVRQRLSGFNGESRRATTNISQEEFPDWQRWAGPPVQFPSNDSAIELTDADAVRRDIANFKAALQGHQPAAAFMSAASPGVVDTFMPTTYYGSDAEYLQAIGNAMKDEYRAIVDAGFILQIDCPDVAMSRVSRFASLNDDEFKSMVGLHIEVLNDAIQGLPREKVRLHLCWGNYEGPHNHDVPLEDILDIVLGANVGAVSFEAANPRHAHEWKVFRDRPLPDDLVLVPGVIDSCSNYIEHPELVAERLQRFAALVGPERVIASTDCGFGTSVGPRHVAPSIAWAKLGAMVEGARLASSEL